MWKRCSMLRDLRGAPLWILATAVLLSFAGGTAFAADPVKIGHVAALSGASAQSGEAITRGLALAIDEINDKGGVLGGRKLELIQRDDESNPPKGLIAARELIFQEKVAAIFGGIDTPVSLAIVPLVNKEKTLFMGVWAAGTGITRNGANPNYVFRVSAVDDDVDIKLLKYANEKFKAKKAGLMLINNPWGQSNEKGLIAAAKDNSAIAIAGVSKFENNDVDMVPHLTRLKEAGADAIILVVNAPPGAQMMKSRERMGWTVPWYSAFESEFNVDFGVSPESPRLGEYQDGESFGLSGLDGACCLALGNFRRTLPRACGSDCRRCPLRADLQLLWKTESRRRTRPGSVEEKVSADQRAGRHFLPRWHSKCLRCHASSYDGDRAGRLDRCQCGSLGARKSQGNISRTDQDLQFALHA